LGGRRVRCHLVEADELGEDSVSGGTAHA
jgi:hypothetical protein